MPSDDAKSVKLKEEKTTAEDDKSLSSLLQARKKNPTNSGTLVPKSRPKDAKSKVKDEDSDSPLKIKISTKAAKPKKEEDGDDDDFEVPLKNAKSSSVSRPKAVKLKEDKDSDDDDQKPISKKSSAKASKGSSEKKKKKEDENKTRKGSTVTQQNGKKREKKVYDLPGQKRDPPEERDPMRIFYETLHEQIPNSEMAQIWMMESGLLPKEVAKKVFERKQKKNQQKLSSPIKSVKKTQSVSAKKDGIVPSFIDKKEDDRVEQTKKRKAASSDSDEDGSDDDFVIAKNISAKRQKAS